MTIAIRLAWSTSWNWYEDLQIHIVISADVILNPSWLLERTSSLSYSDYYGTIITKAQLKVQCTALKKYTEYTKITYHWPVENKIIILIEIPKLTPSDFITIWLHMKFKLFQYIMSWLWLDHNIILILFWVKINRNCPVEKLERKLRGQRLNRVL